MNVEKNSNEIDGDFIEIDGENSNNNEPNNSNNREPDSKKNNGGGRKGTKLPKGVKFAGAAIVVTGLVSALGYNTVYGEETPEPMTAEDMVRRKSQDQNNEQNNEQSNEQSSILDKISNIGRSAYEVGGMAQDVIDSSFGKKYLGKFGTKVSKLLGKKIPFFSIYT